MRAHILCPICFAGGIIGEARQITIDVVDDSYIYPVVCKNGHHLAFAVENDIFEILFDYALDAHMDGYFRESVTSAVAAMERVFEFYIRIVLKNQSSPEILQSMWNTMRKNSQRQIGAFNAIFAIMNKEVIYDLEKKKIGGKSIESFRNDVVHQGIFPTSSQNMEYLEYTYKKILYILKSIERLGYSVIDYMRETSEDKIKESKINVPIHRATLSLTFPTHGNAPQEFDIAYSEEKRRKDGRK